ncbi:MAG TPA: pYEATS domain-containing protein [Bryobacteraceae bacterium]|nr:pYEATS domain-containing protein [Bryobacteraceae bacterium]
MALEIKQESKYKGGRSSGWWEWSVWVDGSPAELSKVKSVTYRLHETFPQPIRVKKNRKEKFRLDSWGWGEFTIFVNIDTGEGKPITKRHYLTLEVPRSSEMPTSQPAAIYVCYAASDKRIALALEEVLRAANLNVINAGQISGSSFRVALAESLKMIDAVVAVVSEDPSEWVLFEIGLAQDADVPVILVMEGRGSPPVPLSKLPTVHIAASSSTTVLKVPPNLHSEIQRAVKKRKR